MSNVVVIPGMTGGPWAGIMHYATAVPERRGVTVHRHSWSAQPPRFQGVEVEDWVYGDIRPLVDTLDGTPLLIGKSLGTNAARLAAERDLPATWLTPVLTVPWIPTAIARATAPCLLIGGTADTFWDGTLARRLSPYVFEVDDADHGMNVPGPVMESIAVLGRVVTAIDEFLDTIGWPT